jgi:hypothetical protein
VAGEALTERETEIGREIEKGNGDQPGVGRGLHSSRWVPLSVEREHYIMIY